MIFSGLIEVVDKRAHTAFHECLSRHHPTTQQELPSKTMRLYSIIAFAALAFAAEDLSSPKTSPELERRKIGGSCKHSVSQSGGHDHTGTMLTTSQGTPGTCQKTGTCRKDLGWYSNGDCPNGQ